MVKIIAGGGVSYIEVLHKYHYHMITHLRLKNDFDGLFCQI